MSGPSVSVVIATTGRASLARALASVRAQSNQPDRTIVVLDRPEHLQAVEEIVEDEHVVVTNGAGGGGARKRGVDCVSSDYVAFLDDDDWWDEERLGAQLQQMSQVGADWGFTAAHFHRPDRVQIVPTVAPPSLEGLASYIVERRNLRYGRSFVQTSTMMVRRDVLESVNWRPELGKHQDWDLAIRLARSGSSFAFLATPLVHVVQDSVGSVSKRSAWRASAGWYRDVRGDLSRRSAADFLTAIVLKQCVSARDLDGLRWVVRELARTRALPHAAALATAARGMLSR